MIPGHPIREGDLPTGWYGIEERVNVKQGAERGYRQHDTTLEPGELHIGTDTVFDPACEKV
jgi:hypothetical protein